MILFPTRVKYDNIAFHQSSAVSGGLTLLRAFCQWKIEHHVRKSCVKELTLRNMAGRHRDAGRLYENGCKQ